MFCKESIARVICSCRDDMCDICLITYVYFFLTLGRPNYAFEVVDYSEWL